MVRTNFPSTAIACRNTISPSRLFILRPVATSLLMFGIMLVGLVAYKQLPVSALPEVDYPTIQVFTFYPAQVRTSWHLPLPRRSNGSSAKFRTETDDLDEFDGQFCHYARVQPQPEYRRRRAAGSGVD